MSKTEPIDGARFAQLVLSSHTRMRMMVLAIAPGCHEVDDVIQETCAAIWQKIQQYDPTREFLPWALTFVRFQTLAWLKRQGRNRVSFNNETVDRLCMAISSQANQDLEKTQALELCLGGLSDEDRQLLKLRFVDELKVSEIASQHQRTPDALYKLFGRLKAALARCVEAKLQEATHVI